SQAVENHTRTLLKKVLAELAEGGSTRQSLARNSVNQRWLYAALDSNPDLNAHYQELLTRRGEQYLDEAYEVVMGSDDLDPRLARVRADTLIKLGERYNPQRFGQRLNVEQHTTIDVRAALSARQERILLPSRDLKELVQPQVIDAQWQIANASTDAQSVDDADEAAQPAAPDVFEGLDDA
ncbi:MAG: hypothetical protein RL477_1, partial [Pseudomonadota bacterium]